MAITVLPATGHWDDFAAFMVPRSGGGCVCMSYRDARLDTAGRIAAMREACASEPGPGVVLRVDDVPAGWVSIAPKSSYRRLMHSRTIPRYDEEADPWSIVCFVVRGGYRRRGLMHELLEGAVDHARAHGARVVEGYPAETGGARVDVISGYVGTVALFEAHGFERVLRTEAHSGGRERWLVRRSLEAGQ